MRQGHVYFRMERLTGHFTPFYVCSMNEVRCNACRIVDPFASDALQMMPPLTTGKYQTLRPKSAPVPIETSRMAETKALVNPLE